jgi:transposase
LILAKTRFTSSARIDAAISYCGRNGRAASWKRGSPIYGRVSSGMEACVGSHHLSRKLQALGHDARLMPAKYVRPYSKGEKNDYRDAEAIAEAVQRPTMKFVATKTADQLDLQALHRVRERLVGQRTGIINQIRAFLLERGIAVRQGLHFLRAELPAIANKLARIAWAVLHKGRAFEYVKTNATASQSA